VVAAALNQLARRGEVRLCLRRELRALLGAGRLGLGRTVVDEPVERRKRFDARESQPRAFERHVDSAIDLIPESEVPEGIVKKPKRFPRIVW